MAVGCKVLLLGFVVAGGGYGTLPSGVNHREVSARRRRSGRSFVRCEIAGQANDDPVERLIAARKAESYERLKNVLGGGPEVEGALNDAMADMTDSRAMEEMQERRRRAMRVMQRLPEYPSEEEEEERNEVQGGGAGVGDFEQQEWDGLMGEHVRPEGRAGTLLRFLEDFEQKTSTLFDKSTPDDEEAQDIAQRTGWAFFALIGFYFVLRLVLAFISFFAKFTFSFLAIFLLSAGIFVAFYIVRF